MKDKAIENEMTTSIRTLDDGNRMVTCTHIPTGKQVQGRWKSTQSPKFQRSRLVALVKRNAAKQKEAEMEDYIQSVGWLGL